MALPPRLGQESICGFTPVQTREIPEYSAVATLYINDRHKCPYLHISSPDPHNHFAVFFRTTCNDDTGYNHVLEHMVLNGSERYPVVDIFNELSKQSLATNLNAYTSFDWTMYPFSTQNEKDFHNILDVYLDAVFHPLLQPENLASECHRYEPSDINDVNSPLIHAGVVYNEMCGELTQPTEYFKEKLRSSLLPDTPYRFIFGGLPSSIANLTLDHLKNMHSLYYNPSNCLFFHYGSFDIHRALAHVASFIDTIKPTSFTFPRTSLLQPKWTSPRSVTVRGPSDMMGVVKRQYRASVSWILCDIDSTELIFDFDAIAMLLMSTISSPLYQALVKPGIIGNFSESGVVTETRTVTFQISAEAMTKSNATIYSKKVLETLRKTVKYGFDSVRLQAALHQMELEQKGVSATQGARILDNIANPWSHGVNPLDLIGTNSQIERVRTALAANPRYFEDLIQKHLLDNTSRLDLVYVPDPTFATELKKAEDSELAVLSKSISLNERQKLLDMANLVRSRNQLPKPLDKLPAIRIADLSEEAPPVTYKENQGAFLFEQPTNGIAYIDLKAEIPLNHELVSKFPFFVDILCTVGCGSLDDEQFSVQEDQYTGGITATCEAMTDPADTDKPIGTMTISASALSRNLDKMMELLRMVVMEPMLDNHEQIKAVLSMTASEDKESLLEDADELATKAAACKINRSWALDEMWCGISHMRWLNEIVENDDWEQVYENIRRIYTEIFRRSRFTCSVHASKAELNTLEKPIVELVTELNKTSIDEAEDPNRYHFVDAFVKERESQPNPFYSCDSSLNFTVAVCSGPPYFAKESSARFVASILIENEFLTTLVREQLGAYGASCVQSVFAGTMTFSSYRDPNSAAILALYQKAVNEVAEGKITDRMVENAIIQAIAVMDAPMPPRSRGLLHFTSHVNPGQREARRTSTLATTREDIIMVAKEISKSKFTYAAIGNGEGSGIPAGFSVIQLSE